MKSLTANGNIQVIDDFNSSDQNNDSEALKYI